MTEAFDEEQRQLAQLWKRARKDGCLSPWQQARVYGLCEAWKEMHGDKTYGMATWIAERVHVQGPDVHALCQRIPVLAPRAMTRMPMPCSGNKNSACWRPDPSAQPFEFKAGFRPRLIQGGKKLTLNSFGGSKQKVLFDWHAFGSVWRPSRAFPTMC